MGEGNFDPINYKSIKDMPKSEQKNFVETTGKNGEKGFVPKTAAELLKTAGEVAEEMNANDDRSMDATDVIHYLSEYQYKNAMGQKYFDSLVHGIASDELWRDLSKSQFQELLEKTFDEAQKKNPNVSKEEFMKLYKNRALELADIFVEFSEKKEYEASREEYRAIAHKIRSFVQ